VLIAFLAACTATTANQLSRRSRTQKARLLTDAPPFKSILSRRGDGPVTRNPIALPSVPTSDANGHEASRQCGAPVLPLVAALGEIVYLVRRRCGCSSRGVTPAAKTAIVLRIQEPLFSMFSFSGGFRSGLHGPQKHGGDKIVKRPLIPVVAYVCDWNRTPRASVQRHLRGQSRLTLRVNALRRVYPGGKVDATFAEVFLAGKDSTTWVLRWRSASLNLGLKLGKEAIQGVSQCDARSSVSRSPMEISLRRNTADGGDHAHWRLN